MPNLLKMSIIGHAGSDAKIKLKKNGGGEFVLFSVCVNLNRGKDAPKAAKWVDVACFTEYTMRQARNVIKGQCVMVDGEPRAGIYLPAGKPPRATLGIVAKEIYIIDYYKGVPGASSHPNQTVTGSADDFPDDLPAGEIPEGDLPF